MQYVGKTGRTLKIRFREHYYKFKNNRHNNIIYQHFKKSGHTIKDITIQPVEQLQFDNTVTSGFKMKARCTAELKWIKNLQTPFPLGLNDNILHKGNISRDPDIDIFSLFDFSKRKSRSHGKRVNGNIKRKHRRQMTLHDLYNILKQNGRHRMLSTLSSLSVLSLKRIDEEANNIFIRTNQLYECASIVQSYTSHFLKPFIDKEENHKRHFFKIKFCNKGIDLINLPNIFKNKNVINKLPMYFKNKEPPLICYKYKKPVRNIVFNYNNVVSDEQVEFKGPAVCTCTTSKYCYDKVDHIITGNLEIVKNNKLRNILKKGPKYRLHSDIDFNCCKIELAEALKDYSEKWCKREDVTIESLDTWIKEVLTLIDKNIQFFQSHPKAIPQHNKLDVYKLRSDIKDLHEKFVFVPADKAANNVIII